MERGGSTHLWAVEILWRRKTRKKGEAERGGVKRSCLVHDGSESPLELLDLGAELVDVIIKLLHLDVEHIAFGELHPLEHPLEVSVPLSALPSVRVQHTPHNSEEYHTLYREGSGTSPPSTPFRSAPLRSYSLSTQRLPSLTLTFPISPLSCSSHPSLSHSSRAGILITFERRKQTRSFPCSHQSQSSLTARTVRQS